MRPTFTQPTFDAAETGASSPLGDLPEWRLEDLYPAMDSPDLRADFDWLKTEITAFSTDYQGKLAELDGDGLERAVKRYEAMQNLSLIHI